MKMPGLQSQGRSRERILAFGMEGTGKSLIALDIAARCKPVKVFVVDNDNAWDRMLEGETLDGVGVGVAEEWRWVDGAWKEDDRWVVADGNVIVYHADGWVANTSAIEEIMGRCAPDDWCVVDSGSALWDDVQAWFTQQVFDTSMDDYFMQVRMAKAKAKEDKKALGAFDGWVDWPVINAQYKGKVMKWLVNPKCHLFVTCEQADVTKEETDKETRALYGGELVKPRGQKRIGHNVQTVLRMRRDRGGDFYVHTVKDRGGREKLDGEEITDEGFATWYLEGVAGWKEKAKVEKEKVEKKVVKKSIAKKVAR